MVINGYWFLFSVEIQCKIFSFVVGKKIDLFFNFFILGFVNYFEILMGSGFCLFCWCCLYFFYFIDCKIEMLGVVLILIYNNFKERKGVL